MSTLFCICVYNYVLFALFTYVVYHFMVRNKRSMKKRAPVPRSNAVGKRKVGTARRPGELVRSRTLEEIWTTLREGFQPAEDKLVEYLEAAYHGLRLGNFAVDDPDEQVRRRTSPHKYISYGPPAWFEAPFCIL